MTPADPAGHHNDEATPAVVAVVASSLAAAAAPQPVSRQARELEAVATSTESDTTTTETTTTTTKTTTKTIAAAATAADDPAATTTADTPAPTSAANTTKTTAAAAISTPTTTAAAAAANTDTTTSSSTAAITPSSIVAVEPVQPSPLPLQEDPIDQERRKEDTQQQLPPQTSSPQDSGKGRPGAPRADTADSETETDMSNHRPGPPAPAHQHHHHNQDLNHHHHSHSLSAGYPASTSSGSPTIYSASAAALSTTQYAAASYPVTSTSILATDPFRVSPIASSQMPLPSMRTIDAISQGQMSVVAPLPHHSMSMTMGMPLVAVSATAPYYAGHSMALSSNYALPQDLVQFPLPPHDPRLLNHRGPKKEIKRRTKTGCLTCRKRRIKCDETHPTCNNCRKSKRDCLGYDPIFRQQNSNQGGNTIQPSPGSLPPSPPALASTAVYQNISLAQLPGSRVATSYGTSSSMLPGAYSPATTAPSPTSSSIPTSTSTTYHASLPTTAAPSPAVVKVEGSCDYSTSSLDPTIRQFPSTPDIKAGQVSEGHFPTAYNKMKISEIIDLLGPTASPQQISHTEETFHEITKVYHEMYAPGLSAFFETGWYYFTENGKMSFPKDANLIERMATFLKILEGIRANDHSQIALSGALETRIVWELACTAYQTPERTNPMRISLPMDNDASEARNRVQVVEALLCGDYLPTNLLSPPVSDNDHHRIRQFDFWYCLGEFVRKQDNPSAPMNVKSREDALGRMRHLLDGRENRDVLYSIAVVRELAPGFEAGYASTIPQHLDETDPKNRLAVASKFILDESQVSGGTTNVVRRFSDIAARAFVNPGVNIVRRA